MTETEQFLAEAIVKNALQTEYLDDGSPSFQQLDYKRCVFCGADNLDSAKNDKIAKPVLHDKECAFVKSNGLLTGE